MRKIFKTGTPYVWLTGGTLTISLLMIIGLIILIMVKGLGMFWPHKLVQYTLQDGAIVLGEFSKKEPIPHQKDSYRTKLKVGNRDVYGIDFRWIDNAGIVSQEYPKTALTIERREWGNMYGFLKGMRQDNGIKPMELAEIEPLLSESQILYKRIRHIEKREIGKINHKMEKYRLELKRLMMQQPSANTEKKITSIKVKMDELEKSYSKKVDMLTSLYTVAKEKRW